MIQFGIRGAIHKGPIDTLLTLELIVRPFIIFVILLICHCLFPFPCLENKPSWSLTTKIWFRSVWTSWILSILIYFHWKTTLRVILTRFRWDQKIFWCSTPCDNFLLLLGQILTLFLVEFKELKRILLTYMYMQAFLDQCLCDVLAVLYWPNFYDFLSNNFDIF